MAASPLATSLQAYLAQLNQSNAGAPAVLSGFISKGGDIRPIPGDEVPYAGAVAAASEDGQSGIKPAANNGDNVKVLADLYGRLFAVPFPPHLSAMLLSATTSATGETSRDVAGEHTLFEGVFYNNTGGELYIQFFDTLTQPSNGDVPKFTSLRIDPDQTLAMSVDPYGVLFTTGIFAIFSSTPLTLTAAAANAGSLSIFYK